MAVKATPSNDGGGSLPQSVQKCLDDQGLLYLWSKIKGHLALKVDKLDGFALSSNDFTSAEKAKLQAYPEYSVLNSDITNRLSTLQSAMDSKMTNVYKFKGSVASYANLPSSGLTAGDVYNVQDNEMNYAWTGTAWDQLGSSQINLQTITNAEIDTIVANASSGSSGGGATGSTTVPQMVKYISYTGTGSGTFHLVNPLGDKLRRIEIYMRKTAINEKVPLAMHFSAMIPPDFSYPDSFFAMSMIMFGTYDDTPGYATKLSMNTYLHHHVISTNGDKSCISFKELTVQRISGDSTAVNSVYTHGLVQTTNYRQDSFASALNEYQQPYIAVLYGDEEAVTNNTIYNPPCTSGPGWSN